jgi:release factor glutamine methyltransferase
VAVDLCCGSGAVAAVLTDALPAAEVHAADVDAAAVACARRNLAPAAVHQGDLFAALPDALRGRIDLLVANAPYVPTAAIALMPAEARDHEARIALDGGADGLDLHRRIAARAPGWLAPGGCLLIETSVEQADRTAALTAAAGLRPEIVRDDELDATAVVAILVAGR